MDNNVLDANAKGIDTVEFFLSANPGEPVKPLATIASGGEISRIMLAIKTVFQDLDPVQTLVFDEIDSGISGSDFLCRSSNNPSFSNLIFSCSKAFCKAPSPLGSILSVSIW